MRMSAVIEGLSLWMDDVARSGPANMAVDEWLLETLEGPLLRVYRWEENWGSYGYFVPDSEAAQSLIGLKRVRRWTGGGIVDHRSDWTYTLLIPRGELLAGMKGAESYRVIHQALANALQAGGVECAVAGARSSTPGGDCFQRPVEFDLIGAAGKKIAGAGQRRTVRGLLHQGSLGMSADEGLGLRLAGCLAREVQVAEIHADESRIADLMSLRYTAKEWQERR
ncbi:hypothetical protein ACFQY0_02355 [Haloferula chungangensis]|uniref:BPL/LPL catalytic domain-containing protein n=1 Tax=Haloferula chungangensis TaxID=1048331 RepID=A0ABW2L4D3_9BACT